MLTPFLVMIKKLKTLCNKRTITTFPRLPMNLSLFFYVDILNFMHINIGSNCYCCMHAFMHACKCVCMFLTPKLTFVRSCGQVH